MTDVHDKATRSKNMQAVKKENTFIEKRIALILSNLSISFGVQDTTLLGKPDFVIEQYKAIIFTHGCFWHQHDCYLFKVPQTRTEFWLNKIAGNKQRDDNVIKELMNLGWKILIIWECAIRGREKLSDQMLSERIEEWLCSCSHNAEIGTKGIKKF